MSYNEIPVPAKKTKKKRRRFASVGLIGVLGIGALMQSCEEGEDDVPPTLYSTIWHKDRLPNSVSRGVKGDPGWVEGSVLCTSLPNGLGHQFHKYQERKWFAGGNPVDMNAPMRYAVTCPTNYPFVFIGTELIFSYG